MIELFDYPSKPLRAGDNYTLRIIAPEPIRVQIKCFVKKPPPSGFRPCPECGSFIVRSGEAIRLLVSESTFRAAGGALEVLVEDSAGYSHQVRLKVLGLEEERGTPTVSSGHAL